MSGTLHRATLFAAFYCPRARLGHLTDALIHGTLALQRHPDDPDIFTNPATHAMLWRFCPPQSDDTAVVHLTLNGAGRAQSAWKQCHRQVQALVSDATLKHTVWGYTLVYLAVCEGSPPALADLLPHTRALGAAVTQAPGGALAHTPLASGGDLWLLDTPTRSDEGYAAATIYLALVPATPPTANDALFSEVLVGPGAALLLPDLLAHKGYFVMRQYRAAGRDERYKQVVAVLHRTSVHILGASLVTLPGEPPPPTTVQGDDLTALFDEYVALLRLVPTFKRLRAALAEQVENTSHLVQPIGTGDVVPYHARTLQTGLTELDLLIAQGQEILDAASKAVDLVQAQAEKASASHQQRIATLLAVFGIALAVPQLVTWEVACAWLAAWGVVATCSDQALWQPLLLQGGLMVFFAVVAWLVVRGIGRRWE